MKKYDGVLKRVRILEEKKGIKYADTNGKLYITLKVLCIIAAVYGMATNLLFILGHILMYAGTNEMNEVTGKIVTVSVCTLAIIASLILNKFKIYITGAVLNLLSAVFLTLQFANLLLDDLGFLGFKTSFYVRHLIPLVLMVIFMVWLTIIALRAKIKTDHMYKKVTENLYNMYRVSEADADIMSDEQWDEFLKNYDPVNVGKVIDTAVSSETESENQEESSNEG